MMQKGEEEFREDLRCRQNRLGDKNGHIGKRAWLSQKSRKNGERRRNSVTDDAFDMLAGRHRSFQMLKEARYWKMSEG